MADTFIMSSGRTWASSGSCCLVLYNANREEIKKDAGFMEFPMPTMDSNCKIILDLMGATREIEVSGIVTSSDVSCLCKFAQDIVGNGNSLIDGAQGATTTKYCYFSDIMNRGTGGLSNYIVVRIRNASASIEKADVSKLSYTISMLESAP